jgi:hypothetical protein
LVSPPSGASINPSTGLFTWTPTEAQVPTNVVITVRVSGQRLAVVEQHDDVRRDGERGEQRAIAPGHREPSHQRRRDAELEHCGERFGHSGERSHLQSAFGSVGREYRSIDWLVHVDSD